MSAKERKEFTDIEELKTDQGENDHRIRHSSHGVTDNLPFEKGENFQLRCLLLATQRTIFWALSWPILS